MTIKTVRKAKYNFKCRAKVVTSVTCRDKQQPSCSEMPTEIECVCCREMKNIEKMVGFTRLRGYLLEISVIFFKPSSQGFFVWNNYIIMF